MLWTDKRYFFVPTDFIINSKNDKRILRCGRFLGFYIPLNIESILYRETRRAAEQKCRCICPELLDTWVTKVQMHIAASDSPRLALRGECLKTWNRRHIVTNIFKTLICQSKFWAENTTAAVISNCALCLISFPIKIIRLTKSLIKTKYFIRQAVNYRSEISKSKMRFQLSGEGRVEGYLDIPP